MKTLFYSTIQYSTNIQCIYTYMYTVCISLYRSGHPLTLHKESLKNLQDLWQSHELSGKITSELDNHREYLRFPWNKL